MDYYFTTASKALVRNDRAAMGASLSVRVLGEPGNPDAIGAAVVALADVDGAGATPERRLERGFVLVTGRPPDETERAVLLEAFDQRVKAQPEGLDAAWVDEVRGLLKPRVEDV